MNKVYQINMHTFQYYTVLISYFLHCQMYFYILFGRKIESYCALNLLESISYINIYSIAYYCCIALKQADPFMRTMAEGQKTYLQHLAAHLLLSRQRLLRQPDGLSCLLLLLRCCQHYFHTHLRCQRLAREPDR